MQYYGLKVFKRFLKITQFFFIIIRNSSRLPYCRALYKRKLITIKKWLQSTDFKKMAEDWSPFIVPKLVSFEVSCILIL